MKVLIIAGHPRKDSFSQALADAYKKGALQAGVVVKELVLADMKFNPNVVTVSPQAQLAEEEIQQAQEFISWADHLVFVYPTWWGTMPALLKGFLDRVFTPGFSFAEREGGNGYVKLLKGKTGQLITTMDTPLWVYRWILKAPGQRALGDATLKFCGVSPVRTLSFSPIKDSSIEERRQWLKQTRQAGKKLAGGILTPGERFWKKATPWLKAVRLQFYPMTFAAYAVGAFAASSLNNEFYSLLFWLGYSWIFLLEMATVFTNDYFDFQTDQQNKFFGPFNGGSRVLVEGELKPRDLKHGALLSFAMALLLVGLLFAVLPGPGIGVYLFILFFFAITLGYTIPPLKLSYRSLGELDVAFTHSMAVIFLGYVSQGGNADDPFPWLLGIPAFFSILPSIILAGIPDLEADRAVSKMTMAVRFGRKGAAKLATSFTAISALLLVIWKETEVVQGAYGNAIYGAVGHGALLLVLLFRYIKKADPPARIDLLMVTSLTYLIWFILIPLFRFWQYFPQAVLLFPALGKMSTHAHFFPTNLGKILGVVILVISLVVNPVLVRAKQRVDKKLSSVELKADAKDIFICLYQTIVVLGSLLLVRWLDWWWADPVAALLIVPYALKEGWEAYQNGKKIKVEQQYY